MANRRVSPHETGVFKALGRSWRTSAEVAKIAGVAPRTARAHLSRFVSDGVAEVREVFPAFQYRLVGGR